MGEIDVAFVGTDVGLVGGIVVVVEGKKGWKVVLDGKVSRRAMDGQEVDGHTTLEQVHDERRIWDFK